MKCVVTGGTGFLGSCLVRRLSEAGHDVVSVSRKCGHDIRHIESIREPFEGAEAVFHLAALVQSRPGPFDETNLKGLENVLQLCRQAEVRKLVVVSSFTVFGPSGGAPHAEGNIPRRESFFHGYDRTKYLALGIARQWTERLPMNIAFPSVIFGPGPLTEGNILVRLLRRWHRLRLAALPLYGRPVWNFVFVEDVAEGLLRLLEAPPGGEYILGGSDSSLSDLARSFSETSGRRIWRVGLPSALFKMGAYAEDWASRIGRFPPMVLPHTADFFLNDWRFSSAKARRDLGYAPRSVRAGLEATQLWMQQEGLV